MRRWHLQRVVAGALAGSALAALSIISGDLAIGAAAVIALALAGHSVVCLVTARCAAVVTLAADATALVVGVALVRPPPFFVLGPIVYLTLAAPLLLRPRAAIRLGLIAVAGLTAAMAISYALFPREWPASEIVAVATVALGISAASIWLLRLLSEQLDASLSRQQRIAVHELILDRVESAVIVTDLEGAVTDWNRHAENMYGWEAAEVLGRNILDLVVPIERRAQARDIIASLRRTGSWQGEFLVRRRDGSVFPAMMSDVLIRDPGGAPAGFAGVVSDLSDLRELEDEARIKGELARAVLESLDFPVAVVRYDGTITAVNRAWSQVAADAGGTGHDALAVPDLIGVDRGDARVRAAREGLAGVLTGHSKDFDLEYPAPRGDEERWFHMNVVPLAGTGAVVSHWETTEEHRARRVLEEAVASKDRFLAAVSHELRTPLTAILGLSEELRDGRIAQDEMHEIHHLIAEQSQELSLLVEDLLIAARLDGDSVSVEAELFDVKAQLGKALEALRLGRGEVVVDPSLAEAKVWADPVRFRQVLRNLVGNAYRHGRPPIRVEGSPAGSMARIEIIDHGPGVAEGIRARLFDPYVRAGVNGSVASLGIGLFISRRLAMLMGGDLSYRRERGRTVFAVTLPAAEPAGAARTLPLVEQPT